MNLRESIKLNLKIDNLEDYIVDQYILGKREAENIVEETLNDIRSSINDIDDKQLKINAILVNLISLKKLYFNVSFFEYSEILSGLKKRSISEKVEFSDEIGEVKNIANYILDFYDFLKLSYFSYFNRIKKVREHSKEYYIGEFFISKSGFLFEELNEISKIENFDWNWINFEKGLNEVLKNNIIEKNNLIIDFDYEIKKIKQEERYKIDDLNDEIRDLKFEIDTLNDSLKLTTDYYQKYYYDTQIIISQTYFGDNMPFLIKLYNFLKINDLYPYGWSFFYGCFIIENKDKISLKNTKNLGFIGRIFHNLTDFLILHYKNEPFKFFQSKFLIGGSEINKNFRTNHMKLKYDIRLNPEYKVIDDFFEDLKKVYIKT